LDHFNTKALITVNPIGEFSKINSVSEWKRNGGRPRRQKESRKNDKSYKEQVNKDLLEFTKS
jgi:hypothetical protein